MNPSTEVKSMTSSTSTCCPSDSSCCGDSCAGEIDSGDKTSSCSSDSSCCGGSCDIYSGDNDVISSENKSMYQTVQNYYGRVLTSSKDLQCGACCSRTVSEPIINEAIKKVPDAILNKFYGCGCPIPLDIKGLTVLDLGCGSGRDCYIAAQLVGEDGQVIGIDMTDSQLETASTHISEYTKLLGYKKPNIRFIKGYIEYLKEAGVKENSIDIVISNCVVNLSPNKKQVLSSVYEVLKEGGEMYFSDVYCDKRLDSITKKDPVLIGECLAGALYLQDFYTLCHEVGFTDPRIVTQNSMAIGNQKIKNLLGDASFQSITFRLIKLKNSGEMAIYNGSYPGRPDSFSIDCNHNFITNKPQLVSGNTAAILRKSITLSKYFTIRDHPTH